MKYIVMLGDGMADYPVEALGGKTPLEVAKKPNIDRLARGGRLGMVKTVPDGLKPGSDVANLSAMGYDPLKCYTGRSPLEAVSIGIQMDDTDVAFRCNLVTSDDRSDWNLSVRSACFYRRAGRTWRQSGYSGFGNWKPDLPSSVCSWRASVCRRSAWSTGGRGNSNLRP